LRVRVSPSTKLKPHGIRFARSIKRGQGAYEARIHVSEKAQHCGGYRSTGDLARDRLAGKCRPFTVTVASPAPKTARYVGWHGEAEGFTKAANFSTEQRFMRCAPQS
jgi:hypothetical protein